MTHAVSHYNSEAEAFAAHPEEGRETEPLPANTVEHTLYEIHTTQTQIAERLGVPVDSSEATQATDDYLVDAAEDAVVSPNKTKAEIEDALQDVVVETALELDHGVDLARTPGYKMVGDGFDEQLQEMADKFQESHATLPSGHEVGPFMQTALRSLEEYPVMQEPGSVEYVSQEGDTQSAPWHRQSEASRRTASSNASSVRTPAYGNIHTMGEQTGYAVDTIPTALPIKERATPNSEDQLTSRKWSDMDMDEKALYGNGIDKDSDSILFESLKPEAKQAVLAKRLFEIQSLSKDEVKISSSSERNRVRVERGELLVSSDLTHSTSVENLSSILEQGLLAGELLGESGNGRPKADRFPFNLDLGELPDGIENYSENYAALMKDTHRYGELSIVLDRSQDAIDFDNEVRPLPAPDDGHRLIFGGLPSTEIAAICVLPSQSRTEKSEHDAKEATRLTVDAVVRHGQYIPVLNQDGNLALTFDEFRVRRNEADFDTRSREVFVDDELDRITLPGNDLVF